MYMQDCTSNNVLLSYADGKITIVVSSIKLKLCHSKCYTTLLSHVLCKTVDLTMFYWAMQMARLLVVSSIKVILYEI